MYLIRMNLIYLNSVALNSFYENYLAEIIFFFPD
mgnify:CR=1 FL=1